MFLNRGLKLIIRGGREVKIGISTIIDFNNYGNRLQNYASQQVIKSFGLVPETLPKVVSNKIKDKVSSLFFLPFVFLYDKSSKKDIVKLNQKLREKKFRDFTNTYINSSKNYVESYEGLKRIAINCDLVITGSDQVWNYNFRPNLDIDFLLFVSKEKRISYAASFGVSEIPIEYQKKYIRYLNNMNYLSVREHAGQRIIKDLTGREAEVLIDPTMMLNKDEWLQIASKPKCAPNKKYLLTYVLGNQTEEFKDFVTQLAKERDLEVLNLLNPHDKDIHCVDPSEFVYLINHADVMITDSFHGAVFSILMETPFVIFERQDSHVSMNSRIDTLVSTFKMESRLSSHIKTVEDVYNINFNHVDEILKYEREKAIRYLKNAFSIE